MLLRFSLFTSIVYTTEIFGAETTDFVDNFDGFNSFLWHRDDDSLVCVGSWCFKAREENLVFYPGDLRKDTPSHLQIVMKNNCQDDTCCVVPDECTPYTGAQITSLKGYGYGSFRFSAIIGSAAPGVKLGIDDDAFSCFSLESEHVVNETPEIGASICVSTQDPWHAAIIWQHGDEVHSEVVDLGFNACKRLAIYRIDWHPYHLKFFISGGLVAVIDRKDKTIPKEPLYIKAGLFPIVSPFGKRHTDTKRRIEIRLHLIRFRYVGLEIVNMIDHSDLVVLNNSELDISSLLFAFFVLFGIVCMIFHLIRKLHFDSQIYWNPDKCTTLLQHPDRDFALLR